MNKINRWVINNYAQYDESHSPDESTISESECRYEAAFVWGWGENAVRKIGKSRFMGKRNPDHVSVTKENTKNIPHESSYHMVAPRARTLIISHSWRIW